MSRAFLLGALLLCYRMPELERPLKVMLSSFPSKSILDEVCRRQCEICVLKELSHTIQSSVLSFEAISQAVQIWEHYIHGVRDGFTGHQSNLCTA